MVNSGDKTMSQIDRIQMFANSIRDRMNSAVRPYRADGFVNVLNGYGTKKDPSENYTFQREPLIPDEVFTAFYEGNGLFAKIIDTPAEEAIKHGFSLKNVKDEKINDFCQSALDELCWEENFMTAIGWQRLFGGSIIVMLINDGRGIDEPLDWKNIKSIDDLRVYDRSVIQPDYSSLFSYDPNDPFHTRGSRLGMPEYYYVSSRYGNFAVHESRCLTFQNGRLPENCTNSQYQLWGIPEYIRIRRAIQDAELAHRSAPKILDRAVQAIYKMKDLASVLSIEGGEDVVRKRIEAIDLCKGILNTMVIDAEGEDYDFKSMSLAGVSEAVNASCSMLSAISNIPQSVLFGSGVGGLSSTDDTSMENFYNFIERIQRRNVKPNLRYLLSIIFQAGIATKEIGEVPNINIEFNPLWSMSDTEKADLEQKNANTQQVKAATANVYVQMGALDPTEVRRKLADSGDFDVETILDEDDISSEDLFEGVMEGHSNNEETPNYGIGVSVEEHDNIANSGNAPIAAPAATKLPQDMSDEELEKLNAKKPQNNDTDDDTQNPTDTVKDGSVGILVVSDGKVLCGTRQHDTGYGLLCGPGGHIENGETPEEAAIRETQEEFGITPKNLVRIGVGEKEPDTGLQPIMFLCTEFGKTGEPTDGEIIKPEFKTLEEIELLSPSSFQPFKDGIKLLKTVLRVDKNNVRKANISEKSIDNTGKQAIIKSKKSNEDTNNSLPYGLCKEYGIELPNGATPEDAWDALKEKTGKSPDSFYAEMYQKGGSTQKVTHFKTKGSDMQVGYNLQLCRKGNHGKKKAGVLLKGEKISKIETFAGKGSNSPLVMSGVLSKQYAGTQPKDWSHKKGFAQVVEASGKIVSREIHWFEHDKFGQVGFKIKY